MSTTNLNKEVEKHVSFRLRESEFIKMVSDMESLNYTSKSRYIRDLIMGRRIVIKRQKAIDSEHKKQINNILAQISRIGNNYNQKVKILNSIYQKKKKNGDPVINGSLLTNTENRIEEYTKQILSLVSELVDIERKQFSDTED